MAVAEERENIAEIEESRAKVVQAEAEVPKAIAQAFREGTLGISDYYKLRNIHADTDMRNAIARSGGAAAQARRRTMNSIFVDPTLFLFAAGMDDIIPVVVTLLFVLVPVIGNLLANANKKNAQGRPPVKPGGGPKPRANPGVDKEVADFLRRVAQNQGGGNRTGAGGSSAGTTGSASGTGTHGSAATGSGGPGTSAPGAGWSGSGGSRTSSSAGCASAAASAGGGTRHGSTSGAGAGRPGRGPSADSRARRPVGNVQAFWFIFASWSGRQR